MSLNPHKRRYPKFLKGSMTEQYVLKIKIKIMATSFCLGDGIERSQAAGRDPVSHLVKRKKKLAMILIRL